VFETHPPYRLFIGSDLGVWAEVDGYWVHINGNLPNVVVSDLVYHHRDRTLTAATYGRGIWRIQIGDLSVPPPRRTRLGDASALRVDPRLETPVQRSPRNRVVLERDAPLILEVEPVSGAAGYQFEITGMKERKSVLFGSVTTTLNVGHLDDVSRGKWRVSSLHDGLKSRASAWRQFVVRGG
jgi:hypothetical protein